MLVVRVKDGTQSGWRRNSEREAWVCECTVWPEGGLPHGEHPYDYGSHREHAGSRYSCPDCGTRRPG